MTISPFDNEQEKEQQKQLTPLDLRRESVSISPFDSLQTPLAPSDKAKIAIRLMPKDAPTQVATDLQLGEQYGVDHAVASRNRDELKNRATADKAVDITQTRPALGEFISDPVNAALAKDDLENLAQVEDTLAWWGQQKGLDPVTKIIGRFLPTQGKMAADILGELSGVLQTAGEGLNTIGQTGAVGQVAAASAPLPLQVARALSATDAFKTIRDTATEVSQWIQQHILQLPALNLPKEKQGRLIDNPQYLKDPEWLAQNVGDAVNSMAGVIAVSMLTGGGAPAAAILGGLAEGGDLRTQLVSEGISEDNAALAGLAFSTVSGFLNEIGLEAVLSKYPIKTAVGRFVKSLIAGSVEGVTEYLEEPAQAFFGEFAKSQDFAKAFEAGVKGFANVDVIPGSIIAGGAISHMTTFKAEQELGKRADENLKFFQAINDSTKKAQLRELAPKRFQAYARMIEDLPTSPDNIYIPVLALAEAMGPEAMTEFADRNGLSDQLEAATATGGDVRIPLSTFISELAGTETAIKLEQDFRFNESDMTPREAAEWTKNYLDLFSADLQKATEAAQRIQQETTDAQDVVDAVSAGLTAIGLNPEEADANAAIWGARASTAAAAYTAAGQEMTPIQWLQSKNIVLRSEQTGAEFPFSNAIGVAPDSDGITFDQDTGEVNRDENFVKWFGSSKVRTRSGKPIVMYHATMADFKSFDTSLGDLGSHFGTEDQANNVAENRLGGRYAGSPKIIPVYLKIENPLRLKDVGTFHADGIALQLEKKGFLSKGVGRKIEKDVDKNWRLRKTFDPMLRDLIIEKGYDGVVYKNTAPGEGPGDSYIVFNPNQIKSIFNKGTFDPNNPDILYQQPFDPKQQRLQGKISFQENKTIITLFKTADSSTFIHETAHLFLEDLKGLAALPNAPEQIQRDWATALKYLQDNAGNEGEMTGTGLTREQHELFARSFEQYLREGKAPSVELLGPFRRFKNWLTKIYKTVLQLDAPIDDEIRGVFDRMLASDKAIDEAVDYQRVAPLYASAEEAGMTPDEFDLYIKANKDVIDAAKERLLAYLMKDIKNRNRAWYKERRRQVEDEVRSAAMVTRGYRLLYFLRNGRMPGEEESADDKRVTISTQAIKDLGYNPGDLVKSVPPIYSPAGEHPNALADVFGFSSGQALLEELKTLQPLGATVKERTDVIMAENDSILSEDAVREEAQAALENEAQVDLLALEQDIITRRRNKEQNKINFAHRARMAAARAKLIREAARQAIGQMTVIEAGQVAKHQRAERRAAREAVQAAKQGNLKKLEEAKYKQLIAAALASEAQKAREEVGRIRNYLAKFDSKGVRKNLDRDYLDQIDDILRLYDLRKATTQREIQKRLSLTEWVAQQRAKGLEPNISPKIENRAKEISYKVLTLDDFRDVRDAVKSIEHLGRLKNKLLTARYNSDFAENVDNLVQVAEETYGDKIGPESPERAGKNLLSRLGGLARTFDADLTKVEFICQVLDNGKLNGPWWEMIYRPINDGYNRKAARFLEIRDALYGDTMFGKYTKKELSQLMVKKIHIPEIGTSFTKEQLLAIALNRGNSYNWSALLEGEGWSMEQGDAVLSKLDDRDWEVVQNIWDYINTFWPEVHALYKRLSGTPPAKVPAESFQTPAGKNMKGGYYPLSADTQLSVRASQREEATSVQEMFGGNAFRPTTRNGHTKERTNFGGQRVAFDLNVLVRHLDQVTHDIYLREAVIDVDRMIQDRRVSRVIQRTLGMEQYKQLRPWLAAVAGQKSYDFDGMQAISRFFRKNATMAMMGTKATIFFSQYVGLLNVVPYLTENTKLSSSSASAVLVKNLLRGLGASHSKLGQFVEDNSLELKDRRHNFVQEVTDLSHNFGFGRKVKKWQEALMYFTALADYHVSSAAWMTAYNQAIEEGKSAQQAKEFGDSVVRMSQGSGKTKDLSRLQNKDENVRAFLMFYSYMNTNYNQLRSAIRNYGTGKRKGKLFGEAIFFWFAPAILAELAAGRGPDDDEEWAKWAAKKLLLEHPAGLLPMVRDMYTAALGEYGAPMSPAIRAATSLRRTIDELESDDIEADDLFWKAVDTAGYFVPFPASQARITIRQTWEFFNGDRNDFSPVFYKKKE